MMGELTNHVWQSTLFAILAGLLNLAFRKNRAQVRYWLWFSASLKFLIPFSLLLALGGYLGPSPAAKSIAVPAITYTVVQVAEPFPEATPPTPARTNQDWILIALFGLWAWGLAGIALMRLRGWLRIRAAVRASIPLDMPFPVEVRSSPALLEPGVVGFFRPVLLCPAGIKERLTPSQLQAVLAHELCHIRRRDNLTAAIHMVVEAVFWFHPLVWWISARLMEERERACDESVLESGSEPRVYAESILKTCQFCVESPLTCVSGVTGADLKKRIIRIMTQYSPGKLGFGKKLLLLAVVVAAVTIPVVFGLLNAPQIRAQLTATTRAPLPSFEVASIKRNPSVWNEPTHHRMDVHPELGGRLTAHNAPLMLLIQRAYAVQAFQVVGGPAWINTDGYDVEAKPKGDTDRKQMWLMLQTLLADRFKLTLHRETRKLPVYDLKAVKRGPKLPMPKAVECFSQPPDAPPAPPPPGQTDCGYVAGPLGSTGLLQLEGSKVHMADLVSKLALVLGRPVLDKTEFTGEFDLNLSFTADEATMGLPGSGGPGDPGGSPLPTDRNVPSIFAALEEQLGLKLVRAKGPVEVLVIDHVERPSEN